MPGAFQANVRKPGGGAAAWVRLKRRKKLATPVFNAIQHTNVHRPGTANARSLKDAGTVRNFFAGTGLVTLADLPWFPAFLAAALIPHPWFGYLAIFGGLVALGLTPVGYRRGAPADPAGILVHQTFPSDAKTL